MVMLAGIPAIRLACVVAVAGVLVAATRDPKAERPVAKADGGAVRWRVGDIVPAAVPVTMDEGYGRSYGIAIIEGKLVLVVDRTSRQVLEVLE